MVINDVMSDRRRDLMKRKVYRDIENEECISLINQYLEESRNGKTVAHAIKNIQEVKICA